MNLVFPSSAHQTLQRNRATASGHGQPSLNPAADRPETTSDGHSDALCHRADRALRSRWVRIQLHIGAFLRSRRNLGWHVRGVMRQVISVLRKPK